MRKNILCLSMIVIILVSLTACSRVSQDVQDEMNTLTEIAIDEGYQVKDHITKDDFPIWVQHQYYDHYRLENAEVGVDMTLMAQKNTKGMYKYLVKYENMDKQVVKESNGKMEDYYTYDDDNEFVYKVIIENYYVKVSGPVEYEKEAREIVSKLGF